MSELIIFALLFDVLRPLSALIAKFELDAVLEDDVASGVTADSDDVDDPCVSATACAEFCRRGHELNGRCDGPLRSRREAIVLVDMTKRCEWYSEDVSKALVKQHQIIFWLFFLDQGMLTRARKSIKVASCNPNTRCVTSQIKGQGLAYGPLLRG